jgi:predicted enzyme related to lactoylglutathione lyase
MTAPTPEPGSGPGFSNGFQVTVDCADPYQQAVFWSQVLGYEIERKDAFIRDLMAQGLVQDDDVIEIEGSLFFRIGVGIRRAGAEEAQVREPGGRLLFLRDPRPKTEKNRMHLDVNVGADRLASETDRLVALGAKVLYEHNERDGHWVTLTDPEGNEFCLQ